MDRPIVVTGAGGYVGGHVLRLCPDAVGLSRDHGDVADLGERIREARPRAVLHLAAIPGIATCTADPDEAHRVNVEGTRVVASAAAAVGAQLVHVSTDQVFDGTSAPYREEDRPSPISIYGETKVASEAVAREECVTALIVRLHLVVGRAVPPRQKGTDRFLRAVARGDRPVLFEDEHRSPIHVVDAARALIECASTDATGILHLGGPERLSRLAIGRLVLDAAGLDPGLVEAGSCRDYDGPPRTPDTSFDTALAQRTLRRPPRPLEDALRVEGV